MSADLQFKYHVFLCLRGADIGQQYQRAVSFSFIVTGVGWESGHEKKERKKKWVNHVVTYLGASHCSSQAIAASGSSKKYTLSSPSTRRRAGNSVAYFMCLMQRCLLASMKVLRLRCTSAGKSRKTAIILFPKGIFPFSLLNRRIVSLSLKLRNFAIKVRGGAAVGGGLPDMQCAQSMAKVGENTSSQYVSQSSRSRNVGGSLDPLRLANESKIAGAESVLNDLVSAGVNLQLHGLCGVLERGEEILQVSQTGLCICDPLPQFLKVLSH